MARRSPGDLLKRALAKMQEYLVTQQGADGENGKLAAIVEAYLTSVLLPASGSKLGVRDTQELRTLAKALDRIVKGDTAGAADFLIVSCIEPGQVWCARALRLV